MPFGSSSPFEERTLQVNIEGDASGLEDSVHSATAAMRAFRLAVIAAGLALTAFGVGGIIKATQAAAAFEEQMVEVAKVTDEQTAAAVGNLVRQMSQDIPVAAGNLAEIAAVAGRLGVRGSENIATFTETIAKMAVATNLAEEEAATAMARLSNALRVPIEDAENMGSAINELSNTVAASSSDIVQSMLKAAPAAAQLGLEFHEVAAIQATLVASGMQVARAGTRMNRAFTELSQNTDVLAEQLGLTQQAISDMIQEDPVRLIQMYIEHLSGIEQRTERVRLATEAFGAAGAKAILTLASSHEELNTNLETSAQAYAEATSLQIEFDKAIQTFNAQLQITRNRLAEFARTVGDRLLPPLTNFLQSVNALIGRINELNSASEGMAGLVGLIASGLSGLIIVLGSIISHVGITSNMFQGMRLVISRLVLPIGALIAVIEAFRKNLFGLQDAARNVINTFTTEFAPTFNVLENLVSRVTQVFSESFTSMNSSVSSVITAMVSDIEGRLITAIQTVAPSVNAMTQQALTFWIQHESGVINAISSIENAIRTQLNGVLEFIRTQWEIHGETVTNVVEQTYTQAVQRIQEALNQLQTTVVQPILDQIRQVWEQHGQQVLEVVQATFQRIVDDPVQALNTLVTRINGVLGIIVAAFRENFGVILTEAQQTFTSLLEAISTTMSAVNEQIVQPLLDAQSQTRIIIGEMVTESQESFQIMTDAVGQIMTTFVTEFGEHIRTMAEIWEQHISGPDGILANARTTFEALWTNVIQPALNTIQEGWDLFGGDLIATLEVTLERIATLVETAFDGLLTTVNFTLNVLSGDWENAWSVFPEPVESALNTIQEVIGNVLGFINENIIQPFLEIVERQWEIHGENLMQEVEETWTAIQEGIQQVLDLVTPVIEAALQAWEEDFTNFKEIVTTLWSLFGDEIITVAEFFLDVVSGLFEFFIDAFLTSWTFFLNVVQGDWDEAWTAVEEFIIRTFEGIISFAEEWGGRFVSWATGMLDDVFQAFVQWANDLIFGSLINEMFDAILSSADNFGSALLSTLQGWLNAVVGVFEDALGRVASIAASIISTAQDAQSQASSALSSAQSAASNAASAAARAARDAANAAADRARAVSGSGSRGGGGAVPSEVDIPTPSGGSGGVPTPDGGNLDPFQKGGIVPRGVVPAALHGPEAVIPLDARGKRFLSDALSGGETFIVRGDLIVKADNPQELFEELKAHL